MTTENGSKSESKEYKSPKRKLIRFFEGSRNKWKKKAKDAKYQIKLLRKRLKSLEKSKNEFKKSTKDLKKQVQQLKEKEKMMLEEINRLKKNG